MQKEASQHRSIQIVAHSDVAVLLFLRLNLHISAVQQGSAQIRFMWLVGNNFKQLYWVVLGDK